ncbi:coenzyme F420-reducing hydrogenase subunit delta [Methanocaldococcus villosus KIN24-T80]|uniref:Coenzyme F420-reducing hydrogenase subunit delta n=1 Tax=Methanocaldococcus villosus KIN24-T80 TaxID=1069083 RepID=N6UUW3_9EURY|nr:coenzyme F420-reducing hydrogenase, FrhD protein [Methanocaldococcus villosus]ENN96144.1 coenzyme F420-reducing hydrogenase subunit delta [Methanocaldococcus villosus KIN24-T80]
MDLNPSYLQKEILIIGCGNILFADDGFAYHVIEKLKEKINDDRIAILDAGCAASHVLSLIDEESKVKKVLLVDVIDYGLKPGELKILSLEELPDVRYDRIDIHNYPLAEKLKELSKKGIEVKVIGCQAKYISEPDVHIGLSKEVEDAIDRACDLVIEEVKKWLK